MLSQKQRHYCMSKVKSKNTDIELILRKNLWHQGFRYRLNSKLPGSPDLIFLSLKIAIFVDGCFWHGCPIHGKTPKTNRNFWGNKLSSNQKRDQEVTSKLKAAGWTVLRFWGHQITKDLSGCINSIKLALEHNKKESKLPRRSSQATPEVLRNSLLELIKNFEDELKRNDLRKKVLSLIPAHHILRDLGSSLIPRKSATSARDRIIFYFLKYPHQVIQGDELMVISGIGEWARRVRELRVQFGWNIATGITAKELLLEEQVDFKNLNLDELKPEDYILLDKRQDRDAAFRWNKANEIRKSKASVQDKILNFFISNVGTPITGEELRYVSGDKTEWARRVRELRTEEGWAISTKNMGRPDLAIGVYILEDTHQAPPHDRKISDETRRDVLRRDHYSCQKCGWNFQMWDKADPRHLELHHVIHHENGGQNTVDNLITLCTVCHDIEHKKRN